MISSLSQEDITQYASDAQTTQEPTGTDFSKGAVVAKTIPAKWWNWLFSATTKRVVQSKTDASSMLTELKNVVTDAGLTPSASDDTQLLQSVKSSAKDNILEYTEIYKEMPGTYWFRPEIICSDKSLQLSSIDMYYYQKSSSLGLVHFAAANSKTYYSLDCVHWFSLGIAPTHDVNGNYTCYVVGNYVYGYIRSYNVVIIKRARLTGQDLVESDWTTLAANLSGVNPTDPRNGPGYIITVIADKLFLLEARSVSPIPGGEGERIFCFSNDSDTYTVVGSTQGLWSDVYLYSTYYVEAIKIDNYYYVGLLKVNLDGTNWQNVFSGSGTSYGAVYAYTPVKLRSGAFYFKRNDVEHLSTGNYSSKVYYIDADGNVGVSDVYKNAVTVYTQSCKDVAIIQDSDKHLFFTYDFITFEPLPRASTIFDDRMDGWRIGQKDDYYYINASWRTDTGFQDRLYVIKGSLSSDINDYELISTGFLNSFTSIDGSPFLMWWNNAIYKSIVRTGVISKPYESVLYDNILLDGQRLLCSATLASKRIPLISVGSVNRVQGYTLYFK